MTHKGLSGPAILQLSTYWQKNQAIALNFLPRPAPQQPHSRQNHPPPTNPPATPQTPPPHNLLIHLLNTSPLAQKIHQPLQHLSTTDLQHLQIHLQQWQTTPTNTEGMNKAEVSSGGIDTRQFNPRTFENKTHKNLYAIGEALDVTGWLGGYNFQWAWSSAWCCAQALGKNLQS
ncbi:NAD(P)/FAD-dependent oxidoreductase [Rappaport israeli]|uniref:NAD(P)/FAD-dependent oxidoreductase n=1 Tax=Rappaport israeli TaxID=1839807 RepID=UPI0038CD18B3